MILGYTLFLNDYLWCSYSLFLNFILKIFFFFIIFFFILIKSNKQINTTDPFNKWVGLGLKNLNLFNKHVGLVLTYVVEYLWLDTTRTRHANMNCHPYFCGRFYFFSKSCFTHRREFTFMRLPWFHFHYLLGSILFLGPIFVLVEILEQPRETHPKKIIVNKWDFNEKKTGRKNQLRIWVIKIFFFFN